MKKRLRPAMVFLALSVALLACVSVQEFVPRPGQPASSADAVATAVVLTFQALTPPVEDTGTETSGPAASLLPHSLYYQAADSAGRMQIFRMEPDGRTEMQLTFEPVAVTDFDVSLADGSIAYVASNQLLLADADGSNRRVLVDGGSGPDLRGSYSPVYSPDGTTIAYSRNGLNLYDVKTGSSSVVLQDNYQNVTDMNGVQQLVVRDSFLPQKYSPDGSKLLLKVAHPPDSPWTGAIYTPGTNTLMQFGTDEESVTCCTHYGGAEWSADSTSFYAVARTPDASSPGGALWKVDATTGAVTELIEAGESDGTTITFNYPYHPFPAPDGQLYYFFLNYPESAVYTQRAPLQLVRSALDGTNQTVQRSDTFELMNEALWAPDASFVVVAMAPAEEVYDGGLAKIIYLDGRPDEELMPSAQQMKWGP